MKKLLVAILAVTLMASPVLASGGKKKAKKKAKVECTKKCSETKNCPKESSCCIPGCCA